MLLKDAQRLEQTLPALGIPHDMKIYPQAGHSFMSRPANWFVGMLEPAMGAGYQAEAAADAKRRLRLWLADCAAHVLHFYEKKGRSDAPRKAIIAARARARGEIPAAAAYAAYAAAYAADAGAYAAAAAAAADAYAAARSTEMAWQLGRLIAWFSEPKPQDWPLPELSHA